MLPIVITCFRFQRITTVFMKTMELIKTIRPRYQALLISLFGLCGLMADIPTLLYA